MTITTDIALRNFEFWGRAEINAKELFEEQLDELENILGDEPMTENELNDLMGDDDYIASLLGFDNFENIEIANSIPCSPTELSEIEKAYYNYGLKWTADYYDLDNDTIALIKKHWW